MGIKHKIGHCAAPKKFHVYNILSWNYREWAHDLPQALHNVHGVVYKKISKYLWGYHLCDICLVEIIIL